MAVASWRQAGFQSLGVEAVVGFSSVGSLRPDRLAVGAVVVPHDYFCPAEIMYAFLDTRAHFVPGFDDKLRSDIVAVLADAAVSTQVHHQHGLVCATAAPTRRCTFTIGACVVCVLPAVCLCAVCVLPLVAVRVQDEVCPDDEEPPAGVAWHW